MTPQRRGILFVISAPSGAGKTTLCNALRQTPDFIYSVSCTTRAPRQGEIDGEDYFFLTRERFEQRAANGDFLEWANVHGQLYGTLRETVLDHVNQGIDVLLDIDTQGAAMVRECPDAMIRDSIADMFILPPSLAELRHRLIRRGTETIEQIETRIANAAAEMKHWCEYRYTLISGSVEEDLQKFRAVMRAERYLSKRLLLDF